MDKQNKPLITIGITCFNSETTISAAIESAITQDWSNIEIIIVDDASNDMSKIIIKNYFEKDNRIIFIEHNKNYGAAFSRNTILSNAKGVFVAFFDDDDTSETNRVKKQYETLISYEESSGAEYVACYASGRRVYSNGYILEMPAIGSRPLIPIGNIVVDYLLFNYRKKGIYYGFGTPTCALMARLSTFNDIQGFDNSLRRVEDIDFAIKLALQGGHFIGTQEKLFTQYATVRSHKTPSKNLDSELQLIDKYYKYLSEKNKYKYAKDWFSIRYFHFNNQRTRFILNLIIFLMKNPISGTTHIIRSFPKRLMHERSISKKYFRNS